MNIIELVFEALGLLTHNLIVFIFLEFLIAIFLFSGIVLLIIGLIKGNRFKKTGIILISIPVGFIGIIFFGQLIFSLISTKPTERDLEGTYRITKETRKMVGPVEFYNLKFKPNHRFTFSTSYGGPYYLSICDSGEYSLNYDNQKELSFKCNNEHTASAKIERGLGRFEIIFYIHLKDPLFMDDPEIRFEKVKR